MLKWLRPERKEVPAATLGSLQIVRPWARSSLLLQDTAGGFMTVINEGETDRLASATCAASSSVEIHAIRVKGARLQMQQMEGGLLIPPAYPQILKPRGYHLLICGLAAPLAAGAKLPITLVFEKTGSLTVDFAVQAPGAVGQAALHQPA